MFYSGKMGSKSSSPLVRRNFVTLLIVALIAGERIHTASGKPAEAMLVAPDLTQHVFGSLFNLDLLNDGVDCTTHLLAKCLACQAALDMIIVPAMSGNTTQLSETLSEPSVQLATAVCVDFNVTTAEQCKSIVEQTLSSLFEKYKEQPRTDICSSLLHDCHCEQLLPSRK